MEAKGEISMRMVHCEDCGKRYDYDVDGFCPRCGAFNQPAGDGDAPQLEKKPEFQQREKPQAAKQPAMDLSRDKNAEEMKWSPLEMGAAKQAHGA